MKYRRTWTWVPEGTGKFHSIAGLSLGLQRSLSKIVLGVVDGTVLATVNCWPHDGTALLPVFRNAAPGAPSESSAIQSGPQSTEETFGPPVFTR